MGKWIQDKGKLTDYEMKKIFNCGIGYIITINPNTIKNNKMRKLRVGILGSTKGTDLDYIVKEIKNKTSLLYDKIEIVLCISNKKDSGILDKCNDHNIPNLYIPCNGEEREVYDAKLSNEFQKYNTDIILCIGWMRIISEPFIDIWKNRCINVHPSLLPKYSGGMDINVHKAVLDSGDNETGCTVHIITKEVDKGPIIVQKKCIVQNTDTVDSLKSKVQNIEGEALVLTLHYYASGIIELYNNNLILGTITNK